ncbi:MAG: amidohydrolase family protein [Janthinobacterium lividum]
MDPTGAIDTHSHFYGETLFACLSRRDGVPRVESRGAARFMVTPTSRFELRGGFVSVDERLAWMDANRIARQVMTFPGALGPDVLPAREAVPLVRDVNDELASVCRAHPDRFVGLAGLPLADLGAAMAELERARGLGLIGFILPSNYAATLAHLDSLTPLFAVADQLGAHVMLHPGLRADEDLTPRAYADLSIHRASSLDLHSDIGHALTTVIYSRLTTRYRNVTVQVVNLGGTFPVLIERMDQIVATRDPTAPRPSSMLDGIWVDNASLGPHALALAVAVFGADRILMGTDYPIFETDISLAAARNHGSRELILAHNAAKLLASYAV